MTLRIIRCPMRGLPWWKPFCIWSPRFGKFVLYWMRLLIVYTK